MKKVLKDIIKKNIVFIILLTIFAALNVYLLTIPPKVLGQIIDLLYDIENNKDQLLILVNSLIICSVEYIIVRVLWKMNMQKFSRGAERTLINEVFNKFLHIKLDSIQNIKNGELMSYMTKDVGEIRGVIYRISGHGTRFVIAIILAIYSMQSVDIKLTILVSIPVVLTMIFTLIIKEKIEASFKKTQKYFTRLSEYVQESTDAIRTTKAYAAEDYQYKNFVRKNELLKKGNMKVDFYQAILSNSVGLCFGICYAITIIVGSKLVLNNTLSVGDLVAFLGYLGLLYSPTRWLPGLINKIKRAQVSYKRLDKIFKLESEKLLLLPSNNIENLIHGDIQIKDLTFNYPEYEDEVLKNISLEIKEGQTIGIIGTIGAGKTTLVNLLLRLYDFPRGKIFIGGQDILDLDLVSLRKSICYITQDNFLFSTTIKNNITLFRNNKYEDDNILRSAEKSMFKEDLDNMSDGLDTIIGERGIDLSGGQKQRVVISRAFLNRSNIIIFDDTFSALDNKTEEYLLENVRELTKGKTCIIISNRISDIKDADKIIVLDNGKIVQEGVHTNLINEDGLYKNFYIQQSSKDIN